MGRVVYLSAASSYSHSLPAYGHLRALAERRSPDWQWELLEKLIGDNPSQAAVEAAAMLPDLLVSTVYLFNRSWILEVIARFAVLAPGCRILLGGPEFLGGNHPFLAAHPEVDAVVRGDETALPELLSRFADKDSWGSIPGVCLRDRSGGYADGGTSAFDGALDDLPSLYAKGYFNRGKPFQHYETSRGCASRCSFCTSAKSAKVKYHSMERISSDLKILDESGCSEIRILDRTFNENASRACELIELFNSRFPHIRFHLEIDPARVTPLFLDALAAAKETRFHLEAGVQTLAAEVLRTVGRSADPEQVMEALRRLGELPNVELHADLIAGLPGQTEQEVRRDVASLAMVGVQEIQLELLKILPGTPLADNPFPGLKWSPIPPYEVLATPTMPTAVLLKIATLSRLVDSFHNFPGLRSAFRLACFRNAQFIDDFAAFGTESLPVSGKSSPSARFTTLRRYATERNDEILKAVVDFSAMMWGYKGDGTKSDTRSSSGELLWRNADADATRPVLRMTAAFPCDAYALWRDLRTSPTVGTFTYAFEFPRHSEGARACAVRLCGCMLA